MKQIIISYKSRNQIYKLFNILKQHNINARIVNTPNQISKSCGLSLQLPYSMLKLSINIIQQFSTSDFIGIFTFEEQGFYNRLQRLY